MASVDDYSTEKPRIRAAVIGTGGVASSHLSAFVALSDQVDLVAAVDIDSSSVRAFCEKTEHARGYTDPDQMLLDERPDLVAEYGRQPLVDGVRHLPGDQHD